MSHVAQHADHSLIIIESFERSAPVSHSGWSLESPRQVVLVDESRMITEQDSSYLYCMDCDAHLEIDEATDVVWWTPPSDSVR